MAVRSVKLPDRSLSSLFMSIRMDQDLSFEEKKRCLLRYSLVGADYQMTNVSEGRGKHCKIKTNYLGQSEVLH